MADALLTCTAEDTEFFMMNVTSKARPNHNKTQLKIKKINNKLLTIMITLPIELYILCSSE